MLTPWEDTGELTTLAQEEAFLTALATATGRLEISTLGNSTSGTRPVRRVTLDTAATPPDAPNVLFVGMQHGNEPAGREAILCTIRDLAETTDTSLIDRCRFHFIPTANPDGFPTSRNIPGANRNMNREHLSIAVVESRYVQQALTDLDPVYVLDAHEHFSPSQASHTMYLPGGGTNADPAVTAASAEITTALRAKLTAEGVTHAWYPEGAYPHPEVLRGSASLHHAMFLLMETPGTDGLVPMSTRVTHQLWAQTIILDWLGTNLGHAVTIHAAAKAAATSAGQRAAQWIGPDGPLDPTPGAYVLDAPGPPHLAVFGLEHTVADGKVRVPVAQPLRGIIPHLFDTRLGPEAVAGEMEPAVPPGLQLYLTNGRPATLMRSNGTPATA